MTDLLVIAASNGENLILANRFNEAAKAKALSTKIIDMTGIGLPLFTPQQKKLHVPYEVKELGDKMSNCKYWIICTPEYNGSIPPVLSNAFAWLSLQGDDFRALFNGRQIAMATHSGSGGHSVLIALRIQLAHLGSQVLGRQIVSNRTKKAEDTSINDIIERLAGKTNII